MDKIYLGDTLLLDIGKLIQSDSIKGIEFTNTDPGVETDDKIYIISPTGSNYLYLRYNSTLFKIGEVETQIQ